MARYSDAAAAAVLGEIHEPEVIGFLEHLIGYPTVNPPGDVRGAVDYCAEVLEREGFRVRKVGIEDSKPNLIAEFGPEHGPSLCLCAHLDIVPPGDRSGWTNDPFEATIRDGRVYGRGANDDKGSVTAQVMAAIALARSGLPLRGKIVLAEVADEEIGGPAGAAAAIDEGGLKPDYLIIGEPTAGRVAIGEKGFQGCQVITYGKTAHGALPWEGANAIEAMAEVIVALRRELWPLLKDRTNPYFQPSAASVNLIEGGVKANVVPDRCKVYIDRRALPGDDLKGAVEEVRRIAERAVQNVPGTSVDVVAPMSAEAIMNPPDAPQVVAMVEANRFLDLDTELTAFSMGTDGRHFFQRGYLGIIYGPGDPAVAHIQDEYVGIEEVMQATRAYALAALDLLGAGGTENV
jgi:succinyl-diaminopimelate desuccinylase